MTIILDGKTLSQKILDDLAIKIAKLDRKPTLVVILVGENPASQTYVRIKKKTAEKIGINSEIIQYPEDVKEPILLAKIAELNANPSVDAILVQLPLPIHISTQNIIQAIDPKKDVDGFTPENTGRIAIGIEPYAYPCTPKGVLKLLKEYNIKIAGKHVVIVGRSNIVGKPLAQMLLNEDATVTICHSKTENLSTITKTADILISAVGFVNLIEREFVREKAVVIDVGFSKFEDKISGDVDFENVSNISSFITKVPGGVGPMTIACLMENTLGLAQEIEFTR